MAGDSKKVQPIIIKRIKKGGHAAHGGAWKIAYADFVTAMMAFFLLMWLSESVGQNKKGKSETADERARKKALKAEQARAEAERLRALKQRVEEVIANDERLAKYKNQIQLDLTAEGLRIQIVDDQSRPLFDSGNTEVKGYMRDILRAIGGVLGEVPNRLTIEGHTDSKPFSAGERGYSNWELSADRANASRRELIAGGLSGEKVLRVQGLAASMLFEKGNPESPLNRRISVIVMNRDAEDRFFQAARVESGEPAEGEEPAEPEIPDIKPSRPDLTSR